MSLILAFLVLAAGSFVARLVEVMHAEWQATRGRRVVTLERLP